MIVRLQKVIQIYVLWSLEDPTDESGQSNVDKVRIPLFISHAACSMDTGRMIMERVLMERWESLDVFRYRRIQLRRCDRPPRT